MRFVHERFAMNTDEEKDGNIAVVEMMVFKVVPVISALVCLTF